MEDGFTDATLRRPKTTPVSSASAPLPPVIIAPIFGAGGVVSGSASASPNVASAGNSYSPDLGGGSGAYGPGAGSASAGYPSPAYRTSSRPSAESPRPSTSSGRSGDALGYSQGIALAPTPSSSSSRPTLEIGTRNPVAKGWGKLKAVVKATGQFASGNTPTGSGTLSASTSIPNLRQRIRPNAADYDSDSDASDASDDEGQVKDTVLLKVWEDAGPTAQRKLFGSKDDVFEGKVDGGEGREWKLRYLMLTGWS